jgi:hypothetical protein
MPRTPQPQPVAEPVTPSVQPGPGGINPFVKVSNPSMTTNTTPAPGEAQAPAPGTPEYDAAMAAKFEATQAKPAADEAPARPEWLPEKFKSPEDMAKAYAELEKKLGGQPPKPAVETPKIETPKIETPTAKPEDAPKTDEAPTEEAAQEAVKAAGLDFNALSAKVIETGALEADDYAKLEATGLPKAMVDTYIEGVKALAEQRAAEVYREVGGKEAADKILSWASTALNEGEIEAFNSLVEKGDLNATKLAYAGLKARMEAAVGREPKLVSGINDTPSGDVFQSWKQVTTAMADPRYKTDPAYRASVEAKLGRSKSL